MKQRLLGMVVALLCVAGEVAAQPAGGPVGDSQVVYDAAFEAMRQGKFDDAIAGFDRVAGGQAAPELRAAASEMARLARRLRADRIVFAKPGSPALDSGVPEEDQFAAGRTDFVATTTIASIYAGVTLIPILEIDDFQGGSAVVLVTTAAGFTGSFFLSKDRDISKGMSSAYGLGIGLGLGNGLLLASPLGLLDNDDEGRALLSLGLAGEVVGGVGAMVLADQVRPTVAQAEFAGTTSILGIATVGLGLAVFQPDVDGDTVLLMLAGGLDVGAGVGIGLAPQLDWSTSRSRLVTLSVILGAVAGFGGTGAVFGEPDDDDEARLMAGATLAGIYTGLGLGIYLTRNMEPGKRFRADKPPAVQATLVPTVFRGGGGLGVAGAF